MPIVWISKGLVTKSPPWDIEDRGEKWVVVVRETGKVVGTHETREEALAQQRALYANVDIKREKGGAGSGEHEGHTFRGNQYTDVAGMTNAANDNEKLDTMNTSSLPDPGLRGSADPHAFVAARDKSARSPFLSQTPPDELAKQRLFMDESGEIGYAMTDDGDLGNLFNNSDKKGAGKAALIHGIENGANTLDCFDGFLPNLYTKFGFVVTARMKFNPDYAPEGWDYEKWDHPDVVFMAYAGGDRKQIRERIEKGGFKKYNSKQGKYVDDYDKAKLDSRAAIMDR